MKQLVQKVTDGEDLAAADAAQLVQKVADGDAADPQLAAFLAAHLMKGTTGEELAALVTALKRQAEAIAPVVDRDLIDTCGTGGGPGTFNISTGAAIVAAAAEIPVAKQGVRSIWSLSGGADVLETLGVEIKLRPESVEQLISETGIGFIYAPLYHPVLRRIFLLEQSLGFKSLFHTLIVPFTNPAPVRRHLLGVGDPRLLEPVTAAVQALDYTHALIVHGDDGLDEISITGGTRMIEIKGDEIKEYRVKPEDFGFTPATLDDIRTDEPAANALVLRDVLSGRERGARRNAVLLNAAGALVVGGKAQDLGEGIALAAELIDDGWAEIKLHELVEVSKRLPRLA